MDTSWGRRRAVRREDLGETVDETLDEVDGACQHRTRNRREPPNCASDSFGPSVPPRSLISS